VAEDAGRWERGLDAYASQFGVPADEVLDSLRELVGERMAVEAVHAAGGAWAPDHPLTLRERSLLVIAALAAQGGVEARLRRHVRWAVEHGVTPEELEAAAAFLAVYVGYPRASVTVEVVREELAALEEG
jgi:alkylhydroperoxidase/carboxymuconolactone decarboxylase family protein YurZ